MPRSTKTSRFTRRSQRRPEKTKVLIVCEGKETERNYFDDLKRESAVVKQFAVTVARGSGGSRLQIVQAAIDKNRSLKTAFDVVWCVMDVEALSNEEAKAELISAIATCSREGILLALSNPAFEVWFLAHFIRSSRRFINCDAVITELQKHWKVYFHMDYEKNLIRPYSRLRDRTQFAVDNAQNVCTSDHGGNTDILDCNSSTHVYRLVTYLLTGVH